MARPVKLFDLHPSPNNIKVRLALAFKKIPHELIPVDPQNREPLIKASGQSLTPVLLHGDTAVYDSYAILRYLDANWPGPPRLVSEARERHKRIEEWEDFTRSECAPAVGMTFAQAIEGKVDPEKKKKANAMINRATVLIENALAGSPCLMGDAPNAADFTVAPMIMYGALSEVAAAANPFARFFYDNFKIEGSPKTREWIGRIMEWDSK